MTLDKKIKLHHWGEGKWIDEPDFEEFEHEGMECEVRRRSVWEGFGEKFLYGGHLCGYVKIPPDHTLYGNDTLLGDVIDIHGGITFNSRDVVSDPSTGTTPLDTKDHWIGFDCGHLYDLIPSFKHNRSFPNSICFTNKYRDWDFVVEETKSLASQVRALQ